VTAGVAVERRLVFNAPQQNERVTDKNKT